MNTSSNKEYFQESKDEKSSSINNTIQDYNNNNNNNNLSVTIKNTNNENIKKSCNIDKKKSNKAAAIYDPLSSNNNDNNNKNNNSELNKSNIKEQTKDTMNTNTESSKTVVSSNIKKDVKSMTLEEQIAFYKDQFSKSKRLYLHYENESKKLESKYLSTFEKLKTYEPKKNEQVKILYKYTHDNNNKYYLAQSIINENTTYFIKESQMKELFNIDFSNKKDLEDNNYPEYDFEIDIKQKEETIEQMILQYDNRIKRLNEEIEKNEDIIKNSKDFKAKSIMQLEISKNFYELGIQNIITQCNDVFSKLKNTLNSDFLIYDDLTLKTEVFEELKKSIDGLKSSCILSRDNNNNNNNNINDNNLINSEKWLLENKDFICKILETFKEVIYNYSISKEEYEDQKIKWQSTLDQVIKSHEEELLKKDRVNDAIKQNIKLLNDKIINLEQEKYNLAKMKNEQIDILNRENNKRVNINLLKSVIIQLLTTDDKSIQESLLPVVYKSLQFTEYDINKVKDFKKQFNSSYLSYLFKKS